MDGDTSLPSLFANFLLCNPRDVRGVVCEPRVASFCRGSELWGPLGVVLQEQGNNEVWVSSWSGWPEQWPGRGVAGPRAGTGTVQGHQDGAGTPTPLPVRSLQVPLAAVSPGGAACGIQVVVAL